MDGYYREAPCKHCICREQGCHSWCKMYESWKGDYERSKERVLKNIRRNGIYDPGDKAS